MSYVFIIGIILFFICGGFHYIVSIPNSVSELSNNVIHTIPNKYVRYGLYIIKWTIIDFAVYFMLALILLRKLSGKMVTCVLHFKRTYFKYLKKGHHHATC